MSERLLSAVVFLGALIAAFQVWNYAGGAAHLDYVPWFWKAALPLGIAGATLMGVRCEGLRQGAKWWALVVVLATGCGLLSYYAHINEPQDEDDSGEQVVPTGLGRF